MPPRFNIVMFHPEIPHNTGAAGRLALATGSRLHLVKPLGFSLDEKHVRRTGLDYWEKVDLRVWENLEELQQNAGPEARFWYLSTKAKRTHWEGGIPPGGLSGLRPGIQGIAGKHAERACGRRPDHTHAGGRLPKPESLYGRSRRPV